MWISSISPSCLTKITSIEIKAMLTLIDGILTDCQEPNVNVKEIHNLIDAL